MNTPTTGGLVQVPDTAARTAGFLIPVALTAAAHADCVAWTDADAARTEAIQDEDGRLIDVLAMAARALRGVRRSGPFRRSGPVRLPFKVCRVGRYTRPAEGDDIEPEEVTLILTLRRDGAALHTTISLPTEI